VKALSPMLFHPSLAVTLAEAGVSPTHLFLGIGIMSLSCTCAASGLLLIKSSGLVEADRPFLRRPRWMVGFFLLAGMASGLDMVAYNLLPLSLVAPFAGVTLILTLFLASTGLLCEAEPLSRVELFAAAVVAAGVGLTSYFGPHPSEHVQLSLDDIAQRIADPTVVIFASAVLIALLCWLALNALPALKSVRPPVDAMWSISISTTVAAACGAVLALALKCFSCIISLIESEGLAVFTKSPLWVAFAGVVLCGPSQLYLLEVALASGRTTQVVPLYQSLLIALTIFAGGIFYKEFAGFPFFKAIGFGGGLCLCAAGLVLLASASVEPPPEEEAPPDIKAPAEPSRVSMPARVSVARRASVARDPRVRVVSMAGAGAVFAAIADLPSVSAARGAPRWLTDDSEALSRARAETVPLRKPGGDSSPARKHVRHSVI